MKRNIFYLMSLAIAGGALMGCDTEEVSCTALTAASDCAGYACLVDEGALTGICSATPTDGCAPGFVASTDATGAAVCAAQTATCADTDCGAYTCDDTSGTAVCEIACTDGTECVDDGQCIDGECTVVTAEPYLYVAVVSRASGDDALNNPNPGPDVDAIFVTQSGSNVFPASVESSLQGAAGDEDNTRPVSTFASAVLVQDTTGASAADCDLDLNPGYVALGADGGFIVVKFGAEFVTNDTINVIEVNQDNCESASTARPDAYDVYVTSDSSLATPANAAAISSGWCLIGSQGGNGGTFAKIFNAASCAM